MIVVEAAACGTPSILVREPDNAAVELIEEGVNGVLASSAAAADLAAAIVRVHDAGAPLRERTRTWFAAQRRAPLARALARAGAAELCRRDARAQDSP